MTDGETDFPVKATADQYFRIGGWYTKSAMAPELLMEHPNMDQPFLVWCREVLGYYPHTVDVWEQQYDIWEKTHANNNIDEVPRLEIGYIAYMRTAEDAVEFKLKWL
jgi:hypothetical protein